MPDSLQGQAQFQELRSDPAFMAAPVQEQVQYLREDYLPKKDPAFAKAPQAEQEQYIHEAVLPQIQGIPKAQAPQAPQGPQFNPLQELHKGLTTANLFAGSVLDPATDAITLGYGNSKARNEEIARRSFPGIQQDPGLLGMAYRAHQNPIANTIGSFAGTVLPYQAAEQFLGQGLKQAGQRLLPYTTQIAQASGAASPYARTAMNALTQLQGPAMWARMLRSGLALGGLGAVESQPGHQFDLGRRAQEAGAGLLGGAILPPLEAAGGAVLKGGVKTVRDIFGNTNAPIKMAEDQASQYLHELMNAGMSQGRIKYEMQKFRNAIPTSQLHADLEQLMQDIYNGDLKASHVSATDAEKLGKHIQQVENAVNAGKELKPAEKSTIRSTIKNIRTKAAMKAKVDARKFQVANENHESFSPSALQDFEAQVAVQRFKERQARLKVANENHEAFGPGWQQDKAAQEAVLNARTRKVQQEIANENHESFSPSSRQHVQAKKAAKGELPPPVKPETKQSPESATESSSAPKIKTREYTPEVQAELDQIERVYQNKLKALKEGQSLSGSVYIERQIHGIGLERAAAKRKVIQGDSLEKVEGGLTDSELEQVKKRESSNYQGKAVVVDGKPATVQLTAFGKVKVKFDDGSTKLVLPKEVTAAPKPPAKPTFIEKEIEAPTPPNEPPPANKTEPQKPLTGSVKEMVSQAEQAAGLPEGAGNLTAGQLEKQMGQKLTPEQKDVHANLREVALTEPDPDKPVAKQRPVDEEKQLLHGEVKDSIPTEKEGVAEKINTALENGKKIKWEVAAERTGRSNEVAHITKKGNVKITQTEFTPTHWSQSKNGEVFIHGYNQRGHITMHPIEDVHKVIKTDLGNGFQGTVPNRVLGQRDYLVSDVLNRGPRTEKGFIKTSEAINVLQSATNDLNGVFNLIDSGTISPASNTLLKELKATEKWGTKEIRKLQLALRDKKTMQAACKLFGLAH